MSEERLITDINNWLNDLNVKKAKLVEEVKESEHKIWLTRTKLNIAQLAQNKLSQSSQKKFKENYIEQYLEESDIADKEYENLKEKNKEEIKQLNVIIEQVENYLLTNKK